MDRQQAKRLIPAIAGTLIAMLPMETTPFLISGAVDAAGLDGEAAGWLGTASVGAVALATIVFSPLLGRIALPRMVRALALIVAAAYLMMAFAHSFLSFAVLAMTAGAACGGLLACMAMVVAETPDPDRSYGVIYASTGVVFAVLLFALPAVGAAWTAPAMFVLIAAIAGIASLLAGRVRQPGAMVHHDGTGSPARVNWTWVVLLIVIMSIAFPLYGGVYGFAERKAVEVGLTSVQAGMVISAATMLTIVGSLTVAAVGTRHGRLLPTLVVMGLATTAYGLTLHATAPRDFVIGFLVFGFMQLALNSYFFGLASALDRGGKVAAFLQGFSLIPYALGTGIFGSLTAGGPLTVLAGPAVIVNLVATVLLLPILLSLDRRQTADPLPA